MFCFVAVLVDTKLFILFGYVTDQGALTSDTVLILDVSNPEQLSFVSEYAGLYGNANANNVGAIAGGVIGGIGVGSTQHMQSTRSKHNTALRAYCL